MGSKKKTIRGIGYSKLYADQEKLDLYNQALIQSVASFNTSDPMVIGTQLLDINKSYQYRAFEKLEGASYGAMQIVTIDQDLLFDQLLAYDPLALTIVNQSTSSTPSAYGPYHLTRNYGRSLEGDCPNTRTWLVNGNRVVIIECRSLTDSNGIKSIEVDVGTCFEDTSTYIETLTYPYISSSIVEVEYTYSGTQDFYYDFLVDAISDYLIDTNNNYLVQESQTTDVTSRFEYIEEDTAVTLGDGTGTFLTAMYKTNFIPNTSRYIKAINSRLGIPNRDVDKDDSPCEGYLFREDCEAYMASDAYEGTGGDSFQDVIDNEETKHIMLTYAVPYKDPYKEIIDTLLGTDGYLIQLKDGINIQWRKTDNIKQADPETGYAMIFDYYPLELTNDDEELTNLEVQYMIPMEWLLLNRTLVQKYGDLKESSTMIVYSQKTVKIKWYQTGLMQVIMGAIGLLVFIFTGNPAILIGLAVGYVVSKLNLSPALEAIIGVVLAVVTMGSSLAAMTFSNMFNLVLGIVQKLANAYFKMEIASIKDDMEEIDEDIEATEDAINEMQRKGIYIPLDNIQNYYDAQYTMQYDIYEDGYNYDKMFYQHSILKDYTPKDT